jgi:EmrB/QacA subfamily drug resistance transporter
MRKWLPLIAVCLGTFMLLVDVTIVNVALPDMAVDLSTSFSSLQWVIDIYALTLAALLMGLGSVADLRGRRRMYLAGLAVFAVASLTSGLAVNSVMLITARGVQGAGGAAMFATTIALLNSSYQGRDRGTAFGIWGAVAGGAAAAGPILGGLLTESLSWRWIFFVNLPVSVVAIVMSLRAFGADSPQRASRLDIAGLASFTAGATAATYGLIRASADGWAAAGTIGLLALGVLAFVAFAIIEHRSAQPLLDLSLFRHRTFTGVMVASLLLNAAAFAYLTYSSLWLQTVLQLSPVRAGLVGAAPLSLAAFTVSALIGRFLQAWNVRWVIGGGMLLVGLGALLQARLGGQSGWATLTPGLIIAGIGVGLATPTLISSAMSAVPPRNGGMAAGAVSTARQLGYAFGIAVLGSVFSARMAHVLAAHGGSPSIAAAISGGQAQAVLAHAPASQRGPLDQLIRIASASGLNAALIVAGLLGLAGGLAAIVAIRGPAPAAGPASAAGPAAPANAAESASGLDRIASPHGHPGVVSRPPGR